MLGRPHGEDMGRNRWRVRRHARIAHEEGKLGWRGDIVVKTDVGEEAFNATLKACPVV